jgi:hypothetical protein
VTIRRKLVASTIAASVAMTALAGIPLSSKGLAEKLGVNGVAYAASYDDYVAKAQKVYSKLSPTGRDKVNLFRGQLATAFVGESILTPVIDRFTNVPEQRVTLNQLVNDLLGINVGTGWEGELAGIRNYYADPLKEIADSKGFDLTVDDFVEVVYALEEQLVAIAPTVIGTGSLNEGLAEAIRLAIKAAIAENENISDIEADFNLQTEEFELIYQKLQQSNVVTRQAAFDAFIVLYNAYLLANETPVITNPDGGTVITTPSIPAEAAAALNVLKDKIAKATDAEKEALIAEAVKTAQAAVDKLSVISSSVSVVDGKATLQLNETNTLLAISGLATVVDALKAAAPTAVLAPIKLSIDLGTVTQNQISAELSKAIVDAAIKANLAGVVLKASGLSVELPIGGTFSGAINFGVNKQDATEELTGGKPAASQVYDFSLAIDGQPTTTFNKPVIIQLPVTVSSDIDTDLLSLAKIIQGKLQFYGGRYTNGILTEARDTFSSYVVVENKVAFNDLSRVEAWAGRSIEVVAAKGAIDGKSEGVFAPDDKVTRAEFAKMLLRALDLDNSSAKGGFADVKSGDWFAPYVAAAVEQGIIFGRSASEFDPNATITRAEMAAMIARAVKAVHGTEDVADVEAALAGFSDAGQISPSLKKSVAFVASHKIVVGSNGKFAPNSNATRAEAAVIIYKAFKF